MQIFPNKSVADLCPVDQLDCYSAQLFRFVFFSYVALNPSSRFIMDIHTGFNKSINNFKNTKPKWYF